MVNIVDSLMLNQFSTMFSMPYNIEDTKSPSTKNQWFFDAKSKNYRWKIGGSSMKDEPRLRVLELN